MMEKKHDILWLFDQVAFEHEFKLPDRDAMCAVRSYWHEPKGDADGTVVVCCDAGLWVTYDVNHTIARTNDMRAAFAAAEQYIKQQESAVAL